MGWMWVGGVNLRVRSSANLSSGCPAAYWKSRDYRPEQFSTLTYVIGHTASTRHIYLNVKTEKEQGKHEGKHEVSSAMPLA